MKAVSLSTCILYLIWSFQQTCEEAIIMPSAKEETDSRQVKFKACRKEICEEVRIYSCSLWTPGGRSSWEHQEEAVSRLGEIWRSHFGARGVKGEVHRGRGQCSDSCSHGEWIRIPSREHTLVGSATLLTLRYLNRNDFHLDLENIGQSLTRGRETPPLQGLPRLKWSPPSYLINFLFFKNQFNCPPFWEAFRTPCPFRDFMVLESICICELRSLKSKALSVIFISAPSSSPASSIGYSKPVNKWMNGLIHLLHPTWSSGLKQQVVGCSIHICFWDIWQLYAQYNTQLSSLFQ